MTGPRPCASPRAGYGKNLVPAPGAELIVRTSSEFLDRWATGEAGWDDGRARGEVIVEVAHAAWRRWLAATGHLLQVEPDTQEGVMEGKHD
jgi:hypothetical protein